MYPSWPRSTWFIEHYHISCSALWHCWVRQIGGQGYMEETGIGLLINDGLVEKVWEGTISVLSLDIVRATSKPGVLQSFLNWANNILSSVPSNLTQSSSQPLSALRSSLEILQTAYTHPVSPLVSRPALFLFSNVASALNLLEHAIWAHINNEHTRDIDAEVFRRWVQEGGLDGAVDEVRRGLSASAEKVAMDSKLVYGEAIVKDAVVEVSRAHL
ncbi:hypothetical protein K474DRAFT_1242005 [Panus rudis PR-1116 ss-1]|nr:hypothetical protein K474DRAFT_1242005 [Panus rudis PR-1116 ss-1]